jgi:DNA polymerase-3 subunit gamma/tau
MEVVVDAEDLPKEEVSEVAFLEAWNSYIKQLHKKGEKIMASILEMDTPKLVNTTIEITFPNDTLRVELERAQYPLMEHLRKTLRNYDLKLDISVDEEISKKYAFTPLEKYEKLKDKNPNIELLRKTFGLDIN